MGLTVNISDELKGAGAHARRIRDEINRPPAKRIMGRSIAQTLKDHFYRRDASHPNSLGGTRTHYWARAAKAVQQPEIQTDGLSVSINQVGIGLRFFGGVVKAGKNISRFTGKPTQFLTIPARAEAHGKRAGEFHNLRILFGRGGQPIALVERAATVIRSVRGVFRAVGTESVAGRGTTGGGIYFWLVKQATFKPDSTVLPERDQMLVPALSAAVSYLERIWARKEGGATA